MPNQFDNSRTVKILIGLLSFAFLVGVAEYEAWDLKDLLWGLWISSLSIGYLFLLVAILSQLQSSSKQQAAGAVGMGVFLLIPITAIGGFSKVLLVYVLLLAFAGFSLWRIVRGAQAWVWFLAAQTPMILFMLGFFTLHFVGFHFIHSIFLNGMFPLFPESPFGKTPDEMMIYFGKILEISLFDYWTFVVLSAVSRGDLFLRAARGESKRSETSEEPSREDQQMRQAGLFLVMPYFQVVRMHLTIMVLAVLGALTEGTAFGAQFLLYLVLAFYFLPVRELGKSKGARAKSI